TASPWAPEARAASVPRRTRGRSGAGSSPPSAPVPEGWEATPQPSLCRSDSAVNSGSSSGTISVSGRVPCATTPSRRHMGSSFSWSRSPAVSACGGARLQPGVQRQGDAGEEEVQGDVDDGDDEVGLHQVAGDRDHRLALELELV